MAPKKNVKQEKGEAKALEKQKQKVAEDKTFGLKNKNKSKVVQKYIKGVQSQATGTNKKGGENAEMNEKRLLQDQKKRTQQQQALIASLFKGTENVKKIEENLRNEKNKIGTYDPKASKDEQKIDLYIDQRIQKGVELPDWEGSEKATNIVCKHFLEAVEKRQYGWFWNCPDGGDTCKYRHYLPEGYVLKRDEKKDADDEEEEDSIEEMVERQRLLLPPGGTKVTAETLKQWKKKKEEERLKELEEKRLAEMKKSGGRGLKVLTGKDLFTFDPSLFVDDDDAAGTADYEEDEDYWSSVINENQQTLDQANEEAIKHRDGDADGSEDGDGDDDDGDDEGNLKREDEAVDRHSISGVGALKEDLFLLDDVPDDLDALDDDEDEK